MTGSKPNVTGTTHILPFDKLSPADFERMCLWLVQREGYERAEHIGAAGSDRGRDIVAWRGEERWVFQCKRVQRFSPGDALKEVEKVLRLPEAERPVGLVFPVVCKVSGEVRDVAQARCREAGLACEFWAETELDERVKRHRDILQEFFQTASYLGIEELARYEDRYLQQVVEECTTLETGGVARITAPLADVFVMLRAMEIWSEELQADIMFRTGDAKDPWSRDRRPDTVFQAVPVSTALQRHHHILLLGEPGSGKTTTLKFLALALADKNPLDEHLEFDRGRVPIGMHLREYDGAESLIERMVQIVAATGLFDPISKQSSQQIARDLVKNWLSQGRLVLLLDGLDEVPTACRAAVVQAIARFAITPEGKNSRIIVAGRVAIHRATKSLGRPFHHYILRPFASANEAWPYAIRWFRILKQLAQEEAEHQARTMLAELEGSGSLQQVLGNPLLLRLAITLVRTPNMKTIQSRAELYRQYVEEVLEKQRESLGNQDIGYAKRNIMSAIELVAWILQNDPEQTIEQLSEAVECKIPGISSGSTLLHYLRERLGLLATHVYGDEVRIAFRHSTFREYFVARLLVRNWTADRRQTWRFLRPRLHHPAWRESILLLAGMLKDAEAPKLIRRIRTARSLNERQLHRDLLLAASAWTESPSPTTKEFNPICQELFRLLKEDGFRPWYRWLVPTWILLAVVLPCGLNAAGHFLLAVSMPRTLIYVFFVFRLLLYLATIVLTMIALGLLVGAIRPGLFPWTSRKGRYKNLTLQVDQALIRLGSRHSDPVARYMRQILLGRRSILWPRAARIMRELNVSDDQGVERLVEVLEHTINGMTTRNQLIETLQNGKLTDKGQEAGRIAKTLYNGLLADRILRDRFWRYWRVGGHAEAAATALGELSVGREEITAQLLRLAGLLEGFPGHASILRALGGVGIADERVLSTLASELGSRWYGVNEAAIDGLAKLHTRAPTKVEDTLVSALDDENAFLARHAAQALCELARSQRIVTIWEQMLKHQVPRVRIAAARRLYREDLLSIDFLMEELDHLEVFDAWARIEAIEGLGEAKTLTDRVLKALLAELSNPCYSHGHFHQDAWWKPKKRWFNERWPVTAAAEQLVSFGRVAPKTVIPDLVQALNTGNPFIQEMAAWALGELEPEEARVYEALEHAMESNEEYCPDAGPRAIHSQTIETQSMLAWLAAAAALGRLGQYNSKTVSAMLIQLDSRDPSTKLSAISGLGNLVHKDRSVLRAVRAKIWDPNPEVVEAIVIALKSAGHNPFPIVKRLMHDESSWNADTGYMILERLAAQETETAVAKMPMDLHLLSSVSAGAHRT